MLMPDDNKIFSKNLMYLFWFLMSFQAGYINVGGFLISGSFVSHVTGTSSQLGIGLSDLNLERILTLFTILASFIFGAFFTGYYIIRKEEENQPAQYTFVLSVKTICFAIILLAHLPNFYFNEKIVDLMTIFLLAFCCGIQNSVCSHATNGFLKPTHMTGLSTDIGIFLAKVYAWKDNKRKFFLESRKNILRLCVLFSFIFGGVISSVIFQSQGHLGFLFPFLSYLCFLSLGFIKNHYEKLNYQWSFRIAKTSILATFLTTLFFAFNFYTE